MEAWMAIPGFWNYAVSSLGRIKNTDTDRVLAILRSRTGTCYVGMNAGKVQSRRSLPPLVADAFVQKPVGHPSEFDGVIHLDGDLTNNRADNLLWRPHWFVVKYLNQMKKGRTFQEANPIMDLDTREIYQTPWDAAVTFGLIENDLILSIVNRTFVWPTFQEFRFVTE